VTNTQAPSCLPDVAGVNRPCQGTNCYGYNCELSCNQLCSGNALDPLTSCGRVTGFSDAKAVDFNLCTSCKPGFGPAAVANRWTYQISTLDIYANSMRFCNLVYSVPFDEPNGAPKQCGGYGYSINLNRVASILGIDRNLISVVRRATSMELDFDPVVIIPSYKTSAVPAYIDAQNTARSIRDHPAFTSATISDDQWKAYTKYFYEENIGTRCTCAPGFIANEAGTCVQDGCTEWTRVHESDPFTTNPNGLTCGGFARSVSGCIETPQRRYCSCREGFTGRACEQVLCAHANGSGCSANGYCDEEFNVCVCKPNYIGVACEIKLDNINPCNGNGQQTKSYPLPSYETQLTDYRIPSDLDVKVEWL
jgi:hypothetical protein